MNNIELFGETMKIVRDGEYTIDNTIYKLKLSKEDYRQAIYIPAGAIACQKEEKDKIPHVMMGRCNYSVKNQDSFAAAQEIINGYYYQNDKSAKPVLVLNFANSINPGGGVIRGAKAQEEDLCRKSTLYASLTSLGAEPFYMIHRKEYTPLASDAMILSPNVEIIRDNNNQLLTQSVVVSVLTCAAPIAFQRGEMTEDEYEALLYHRIQSVLHTAVYYRYQYLVLGAWGCGAFGNDAKQMSDLFYRAFKEIRYNSHTEKDLFRKVVFAVHSSKNLYNLKSFQENFDEFYRKEDENDKKKTLEGKKAKEINKDKIRGGLLGGAVGDALGYPVEFLSWEQIQTCYGENGITSYELNKKTKTAQISDDTQMTLFTANGILFGDTRGMVRGIRGPVEDYVFRAYQDWLRTQIGYNENQEENYSWLSDILELQEQRAPGNTCLSALLSGENGTTKSPINYSKGCGGVMRVAPLGLHYASSDKKQRRKLDQQGAELAALTHGHPLGWLPAALLTHIINIGVYGEGTLIEAVEDAMETVFDIYQDMVSQQYLSQMKSLLDLAIHLSKNKTADEENICTIGEGWTGEEALAIAVYCSLRYPNDFSKAVIAAVNHSGDSDSTGAITGNIIGSWLGYEAIEEKWKQDLELKQIILEMADDLCYGCMMCEYSSYKDYIWIGKYFYGKHVKTEEEGYNLFNHIQ